MTQAASSDTKTAIAPDDEWRKAPEYQLPADAVTEGFRIPDDHRQSEALDLARRFRKASPGPYVAFWRVRRVVNGLERTIEHVDMRQWDEGACAQRVDAGDYVRRLIVRGSGGGVNATREFTLAKAMSKAPTTPPAIGGSVEQPSELDELRRMQTELLAAVRSRSVGASGPPTGRGDWVAIVPALLTAASGMAKMIMDARPSTADLLKLVEKRSGMGEIAEAIKTFRDLAASETPGADNGLWIREAIAAIPSVLAELKAAQPGAAAPSEKPALPASAPAGPPASDSDKKHAADMLALIVSILKTGGQTPDADAVGYAEVVMDVLQRGVDKGGGTAKVAIAILESLRAGAVGEVARWLVGSAPALAPHAQWVAEVEAELRSFNTPEESKHDDDPAHEAAATPNAQHQDDARPDSHGAEVSPVGS